MQVDSEHDPQVQQSALPALISVNVHLILFLLLAFWVYSADEKSKPVVLQLSHAENEDQTTTMDTFEIEVSEPKPLLTEPLEAESVDVEAFAEPVDSMDFGELAKLAPPVAGTGTSETLVSLKGLPGTFANKIRDAQANGIEIVIVFDATGSMGGEIAAVKERIGKISKVVLEKIPSARFSLVAYRDRDSRLVDGISLGNDLYEVEDFIRGVDARGGGDRPEALDAGMNWAIENNDFRDGSQKVMLIFGDAPPHKPKLASCMKMARDFSDYGKGIVHTVTCKSQTQLPEFYDIASAGGGQSYTMMNSLHLMEELLVLAFGKEHRNSVIKFFNLKLEQGMRTQRRSNRRTRVPRSRG